MNENKRTYYAAKVGGKSHEICEQIIKDRDAAQKARMKYLKSKGNDVVNLWASESCVHALIVKPGKIPVGWRRSSEIHRKHVAPDGGVFAVPDGKQRATYKALKQELRNIPSLPDCWSFTSRLGYAGQLHGMSMMLCSFEKIGDTFVLSVPDRGNSDPEKNKFVPPDCKELKMSEYWAMKEGVK